MVFVGLALMAPTVLRPEAVLADPSVIPSGSGSMVIGPQAMEGNLQIHPGDPLEAGFDFTMPGSHPAAHVTVENGSVSIAVKCSNGSVPPPIALNLAAQTIAVTLNSSAWYPSGNQSDPSVYQGSLAAPDLCAGGLMSAAAGATFRATVSSTDTTDALHFRFHYSDNTAGSWSATVSALPVPFAETLPSVHLTPALGLTLGVDGASAIPGDVLTYTAGVTNTGASLSLGGDLMASNTGSATTTVASYWDELATSLDSTTWTPFAGLGASQSGYTPAVAPPITSGMSLTVTPVPTSGVTYPAGPDLVLGTTIAPGSTALWHYSASIPLTPSQVGFLLNPTQVKRVRGSLHVEVNPPNPQVTQPAVMSLDFTQEFLGASPAPTGAISGATVSIQPPQGAAPLQFNTSTTPGLASIASGSSVSVSGTGTVQAVAGKGANESDSAYLQRLAATEGSTLTASATASGSGWSGPVSSPSPAPTASTTEHLPIMGIAKSGPQSAGAGSIASYPLALTNSGGATASGLAITDSVPGGATGTVSGVPASLAPGANATVTASFAIPGSQPAGSLADTAAVTWQDGNGNTYGPVSSSFTTTVTNTLSGASLTLAPQSAGPDVVGQSQQLTATLVNASGNPIANQALTFSITGANPTTSAATTDATGRATFSYVGANPGTDQAQATASAPGVTLQSNTSSVSWIKPIQTVSMTPVQGNFFHEASTATTFVAKPGDNPDFSQTFPTIDFNPPAGTVPHNISGVTNQTRPFTDLTTDVGGNFNGTIVAQGNGIQAGVGTMSSFDAAFTGTLVAAEAGDVTFDFQVGDGFILGVGGGATRVSGDLTNPPASNTSVFQGYPLIAAYQAQSAAATRTATVHFPAAGTYPFELDYFECCGGDLSLTMTAAAIVPQTSPLSIYVGYADGLRPGGAAFPFPWIGSPSVSFFGDTTHTFDSGALRFDNSSAAAITLDSVTVDVGSNHFDLWPHGLTIPAQQTVILAQTNNQNFDTSDFPIQCSGNNGVTPVVNVTVAGVLTSYRDTHQVLNTGGIDPGGCGRNESTAWQRIAGVSAAINVPVPPAVSLNLSPFNVPGATVGLAQRMTATAMDGQGLPVANLPLTVQVFGANAQQLSATTDAGGVATFSYVGAAAGADQVQVSGLVTGFRAVSNLASVTWTNPLQPGPNPQPSTAPPPSVTAVSPADGVVVTKPVPITATITPPSGQTIASWQVTYQAQDPGPVVTFAGGSGAPPSPLATFDPTLLPNDTYQINVTAVASNGVSQTQTTTVTVFGNLKLGRYVTTFQDLIVPVNGFQMEVRRGYDSIDKRQGDFGVGWRVNVVNFRTAPNRQLGAGGWSMYNTFCVFGLCLTAFRSSVPHYVSVTFPDQHTEIFDLVPQGGTNVFWTATAAYTARAGTGTTSTLAPVDSGALTYRGDGNLYDANGQVYDPQRFKLTTRDGRVVILDRAVGLLSETDRNGNSLTIDNSGVHASNGQSITFTRDASGRITQIAGPSAQMLTYVYSGAGDLASSTDPNGNQTTYTYDGNHDLLSVDGPNATPLRTEQYDASGRLTSITVGSGSPISVSNDVGSQTQVFTDPAGLLSTVYHFDDRGDLVQEDKDFATGSLVTKLTYDSMGHVLSAIDPLGRTWNATYDSSGNLVTFSDPAGHTTRFTYDALGNPLTETDPIGAVTTYGYNPVGDLTSVANALGQVQKFTRDAAGRTVSYTDALGATSSYTYGPAGHVATVLDALNRSTSYAYDGSGRVTKVTDPTGATTLYQYDAVGNLRSLTDPLNRTTSWTYDGLDRPITKTDAAGATASYAYDPASHKLATVTDPLGAVIAYRYDADSRLTAYTDQTGGTTSWAYDPLGRVVTVTDAIGNVTRYGYDAAGRRTSVTDPAGAITGLGYDATGNLVSMTDALGGNSTFGYDVDGRPTSWTDPLGRTTSSAYDSVGDAVSSTDRLGLTRLSSYDADGQLTSVTDPTGAVTRYAYDPAGRLTGITDPLGRMTSLARDGAGRLVGVTDPAGHAATVRRDAAGQVVQSVDPAGGTTAYAFNAMGRLASTTDAVGNVSSRGYDADQRLTSSTDPRGSTTSYVYDLAGRLVGITDALGGTVAFAYNAAGDPTRVRDADGHLETFGYDADHRLVQQVSPASGTTTVSFDLLGRPTTVTDGRGITSTSTFDPAGEMTGLSAPGRAVTYAYDLDGRVTSMVDPTGATTFGYDADSRLTSAASPEGSVGYQYDAAGQRTALALPSGTAGYGYDAAGNLVSLRDWLGGTISMGYDAAGRPTSVSRPNGVSTSLAYDANGRVTSISHAAPTGNLQRFTYTYDPAGNRSTATSSAGTEVYVADALNRLTGVTYATGSQASYTYDAAGNRLSGTVDGVTSTYTYDGSGHLTSNGGLTYRYDGAGNLVSAGSSTFTYDAAGNMVASSVGGLNAAYSYDGAGLRVSAAGGGATSPYLWDRATAVPGVLGDGTNSYLRAVGLAEQVGSAATATYPLLDALGSVRALTSASGQVIGTTDYNAFGGARSTSGTTSIFGFAGGQADSTGLEYLVSRYLDPATGRMTSPDRVQPNVQGTQGFNAYSYAANSPTTLVDPLGGQPCEGEPSPDSEATQADRPGEESSPPESAPSAAESSPPESAPTAQDVPNQGGEDWASAPEWKGDGPITGEAPVDYPTDPVAPGDAEADVRVPRVSAAEDFTDFRVADPAFPSDPFSEYLTLLQLDFSEVPSILGLTQSILALLGASSRAVAFAAGAGPALMPTQFAAGASLGGTTPGHWTRVPHGGTDVGQMELVYWLAGFASDQPQLLFAPAPTGTSSARPPVGLVGQAASQPNSLAGDTPVLMADGTEKPIQDVRTGDEVEAWDTATGQGQPERVDATFDSANVEGWVKITVAGETLQVTAGHPFWVASKHRFIEAGDLRLGDELQLADGTPVGVAAVVPFQTFAHHYNLTVHALHTYFAGAVPVLVHNQGPCGPTPVTQQGATSDRLALGLTSKKGKDLLVPFAKRIGAKTYLDYDLDFRNVAWEDIRSIIDDHVAAGGEIHFNLTGIRGVGGAARGYSPYGDLTFTERELYYVCSTPAILQVTTFYGGAPPC